MDIQAFSVWIAGKKRTSPIYVTLDSVAKPPPKGYESTIRNGPIATPKKCTNDICFFR